MAAVEAATKEENSEFFLDVENPDAGRLKELQSVLEKEIGIKKKALEKAKASEEEIESLKKQVAEQTFYSSELENLKNAEADYKEKLKAYATERTDFQNRALKAEAALPELQSQLKSYQDKELTSRKRQELHETAKNLGIWEAAITDIQDFAPMFGYNDADELVTSDGKTTARQWMADRLKTSPHWQAPSQGANTKTAPIHTAGTTAEVADQVKKLSQEGRTQEAIALQLSAATADQASV